MANPEIDEVVGLWQEYVSGIDDWQALVSGIVPKDTQCGPVYDIIPNPPELGDRPNEGFAISDMREVKVAEPHYHANGETEIYIVISGLGKTYVGGEERSLEPGAVVVTPPETTHFTIPQENMVMAVINTPPFNPNNVVEVHETNTDVGFDSEQYQRLTADL